MIALSIASTIAAAGGCLIDDTKECCLFVSNPALDYGTCGHEHCADTYSPNMVAQTKNNATGSKLVQYQRASDCTINRRRCVELTGICMDVGTEFYTCQPTNSSPPNNCKDQ